MATWNRRRPIDWEVNTPLGRTLSAETAFTSRQTSTPVRMLIAVSPSATLAGLEGAGWDFATSIPGLADVIYGICFSASVRQTWMTPW